MQFIKDKTNIDFLSVKKITISVSLILIVIGMISLFMKGGLRLGIDFTGGTNVQVSFKSNVHIKELRKTLGELNLKVSDIQEYGDGNNFLLRLESEKVNDTTKKKNGELKDIGSTIQKALSGKYVDNTVTIERVEVVGPKVGGDLRHKALSAMYYAILFIAVYISWRFEQKLFVSVLMAVALIASMEIIQFFAPGTSISFIIFVALIITLGVCIYLDLKFALAAIVALIHDVLITVAAFSVFDREFTLPVIAALLTIIGYSLNDTIVVFDRIRENLRGRSKKALGSTVNLSINQSLNRTILTSFTTLLMVATLFILGGEVIHDFSFALLIGIVVGTYSSVFIASPILLMNRKKK